VTTHLGRQPGPFCSDRCAALQLHGDLLIVWTERITEMELELDDSDPLTAASAWRVGASGTTKIRAARCERAVGHWTGPPMTHPRLALSSHPLPYSAYNTGSEPALSPFFGLAPSLNLRCLRFVSILSRKLRYLLSVVKNPRASPPPFLDVSRSADLFLKP
jgi:hypothetical protein